MSGSFSHGDICGVSAPLTGTGPQSQLSAEGVGLTPTLPELCPDPCQGRWRRSLSRGRKADRIAKRFSPRRAGPHARWSSHPPALPLLSHWTSLIKHTVKDKMVKNFKTVTGKTLNYKWFLRLRTEPCAAASSVSNNPLKQMNVITKIKEVWFRRLQWLDVLCLQYFNITGFFEHLGWNFHLLPRFRGRSVLLLTYTNSSSKSKRVNQTEKLKKELVLKQGAIRIQNLFSCVDSSLRWALGCLSRKKSLATRKSLVYLKKHTMMWTVIEPGIKRPML